VPRRVRQPVALSSRGNRPQRPPSLPQMPDLRDHGLLVRLRLKVAAVRGEPVPVGDIADPLTVKSLWPAASN
jgi:hypothetical protein